MWLMYLGTAFLGLIIGSFLNVLIVRLPEKQTWWGKARSICRRCLKVLPLPDLVPVLSFLRLKGKCRFCHTKISWQYPLVELATMILFVLALWQNNLIDYYDYFKLVADWLFLSILLVVFVIDLKHLLIIDRMIYVVMPIVFFFNWYVAGWSWWAVGDMLLAGMIGFLFYWLQYFISKGRWVGDGDMRLAALLGLMLGTSGLWITLLGAYVLGGLIAIILLLTGKSKWGAQLPMGAFLTPLAAAMVLYGNEVWNFYWNLMYKFL